jgi:hypothetical protein
MEPKNGYRNNEYHIFEDCIIVHRTIRNALMDAVLMKIVHLVPYQWAMYSLYLSNKHRISVQCNISTILMDTVLYYLHRG